MDRIKYLKWIAEESPTTAQQAGGLVKQSKALYARHERASGRCTDSRKGDCCRA